MEQVEYTGKRGFVRHRVEYFGIQRKIVANMTFEGWSTVPHAGVRYSPDVTELWREWQRVRKLPAWEGVTINTLLLYILTRGFIACPALNAHLEFKRRTVNGKLEEFKDVNISMPMGLPNGEGMMTVNVHNCERLSVRQMNDYVLDLRRRIENTNLTEAMFEVSMDNTIKLIKKCKLGTIAGRLWGAKTGKGKVRLLKGAAKKRYYAIPESDRLTKRDIEQGTVLVSNLGSIYRGNMEPVLLDVIPPLVAAIGVGAFNERPGVVTAEDGSKSIAPRLYLPMTITFDHRACDAGILCRFSTAWMPFLPIRRKWKRGYRFVPLHKMHGGFLETAPDGYAERRFLLGIFMNRSRKNMAHCTKNDFRVCAMCLDFFAKMHILSIRAVKTRQSSKQRHRRKERRTMFDNRMDRDLIEMERKLLHEVTAQRGMSWRKFGKLLRLNAVVRAMERRDNSWRAY